MSNRRIPAELHSHSTFSDGQLEPEELAKTLSKSGVLLWSLTDHDTCEGCERAKIAADEYGIEFISGIEISAWDGVSVHVLGYGVTMDGMREFSEKRKGLRHDRMAQMVSNLNDAGVAVDFDRVLEIAGRGIIGRPHLAEALIERGHVESVPEAFSRYIGSRCPAYVSSNWPSVEQAIDIIHDDGAMAVLAHPGIYKRDHRIAAWVHHGLDGIEVEHPHHDGEAQLRYETIAEREGILKMASTDYHGPKNQVLPLGTTHLNARSYEAVRQFVM